MDRRQFLKGAGWTGLAVLVGGCAEPSPKFKGRPKFKRNRKSNPDLIDAPTRYGYQLRLKRGMKPTEAQRKANNAYLKIHRKGYHPPPKP